MFTAISTMVKIAGSLAAVKLGLKAQPRRVKALKFTDYFKASDLPPAPDTDLSGLAFQLKMHLNNQIGDCALASKGHKTTVTVGRATGKPAYMNDQDILNAYIAITGYDPNTGANDNGMTLEDAQNWMIQNGISGHKYVASFLIPTNDPDLFRRVLNEFGPLTGGFLLPIAWSKKIDPTMNVAWDTGNGADYQPGTWGGHAIAALGADKRGVRIGTWANYQLVTDNAMATYSPADQGMGFYLNIDSEWAVANSGKTASGIDLGKAISDYQALSGNSAPIVPGWNPAPPAPVSPPAPPVSPPAPVVGGTYAITGNVTLTTVKEVKKLRSWIGDAVNSLEDAFTWLDGKSKQLIAAYGSDATAVYNALQAAIANEDSVAVAGLIAALQKLYADVSAGVVSSVDKSGRVKFGISDIELIIQMISQGIAIWQILHPKPAAA